MDLQNKKVVQSNTLIKAIAKMDALPLKLFELAVANVDTKEKDPEVELEKDLIRTFLPRTNALRHDYLQTIMTNLMDKSTFTVKYTKENGKKKTEIF
ncbi:replication initiation protein, partial [Ligilactobacillus salivarius]